MTHDHSSCPECNPPEVDDPYAVFDNDMIATIENVINMSGVGMTPDLGDKVWEAVADKLRHYGIDVHP
jgi:hypothetical protein